MMPFGRCSPFTRLLICVAPAAFSASTRLGCSLSTTSGVGRSMWSASCGIRFSMYPLFISCASVPLVPLTPRLVMLSLAASNVHGVFSKSPSDDKYPVPSVGGSDTASWNKDRLDGISVTFKVVADAFKGKGLAQSELSSNSVALVEKSGRTCHLRYLALLDHREDASNVFSNDPSGSDLVNAAEHVRPEVAVIRLAASLPGITEGLTRKSSSENVDSSAPFCEVCCGDVFIRFCVRVPIVEHGTPEWVYLAVEEVLPPEHRCRHLGAAYAAEY